MLYWFMKTSFISLLFIGIIHYLINFFKDNLTQPNVKDMIQQSRKEYDNVLNTMSKKNPEPIKEQNVKVDDTDHVEPDNSHHSMHSELDNFVKDFSFEEEYNNFSFNIE